MSRRSDRPQSRRHVMIYDEDWEFLLSEFDGQSARPGIGPGKIIQRIVQRKVARMRQVKLDTADESSRTKQYAEIIKEEHV